MPAPSIAALIDHSLLHPTLTEDELRAGCELARRLAVASVCIKPYAVRMAAEILAGSPVKVGTVIGFPHGSHATEVKVFEAQTFGDTALLSRHSLITRHSNLGLHVHWASLRVPTPQH